MAIFEVTITGSAIVYYEEDLSVSGLQEDSYSFVKEGRDLIETMMMLQPKLDALNEGLKNKYPEAYKDGCDWEYKITGICQTSLIRFNDQWVKEYLEDGVITRNYEEEED